MSTSSDDEASARWAILVREVERAANKLSGLDKQLLLGSLVRHDNTPAVNVMLTPRTRSTLFSRTHFLDWILRCQST